MFKQIVFCFVFFASSLSYSNPFKRFEWHQPITTEPCYDFTGTWLSENPADPEPLELKQTGCSLIDTGQSYLYLNAFVTLNVELPSVVGSVRFRGDINWNDKRDTLVVTDKTFSYYQPDKYTIAGISNKAIEFTFYHAGQEISRTRYKRVR